MAAPLVACTTRLDEDVDLLAFAGDDGLLFESPEHGLAGRGVAMRIELPTGAARAAEAADRLAEALATVEVHDGVGRAGAGVVAFAALPFDDEVAASVTVPATVWGGRPTAPGG